MKNLNWRHFFLLFITFIILILPLAKIYSLHTFYYDLGVFINLIYRINFNNEWYLLLSSHIHLFGYLYIFILKLIPIHFVPYVLVFIQSILIASPILFFYRRYGIYISIVYVAFFPIWFNILFDFHFDHLVIPLLLGFYLCIIDKKFLYSIIWAALLILVKEPYSLQTVACGLMMLYLAIYPSVLWENSIGIKDKYWLVGGSIFLIIIGMGYFYFAIYYFLPYFAPEGWNGPLQSDAYSWLGSDLNIIANKLIKELNLIIVDIIDTPKKLFYILLIFGSLAFIPILCPALLIPTIPILAISLLSRISNYYDHSTHYTTGLIIPLVFSFIYGLQKFEKILNKLISSDSFNHQNNNNKNLNKLLLNIYKKLYYKNNVLIFKSINFNLIKKIKNNWYYYLILILILIGNILISPSPISRIFWTEKIWAYNWRAYIADERDDMIKEAIRLHIPDDPVISVTTQNSLNYSYLSNRNIYLSFPNGIFYSYKFYNYSNTTYESFLGFLKTGNKPKNKIHEIYSDYLVLDFKRPLFLIDEGCLWLYGKCKNRKFEYEFYNLYHIAKANYRIVYKNDDFIIMKRI